MIDGVVISQPADIANLDPENVEKIDALKERYYVGDYLFYGLINVITRAGNFSAINMPDYAVRISYRVVEPVNSFKSPDYTIPETRNNRIPDFRNTLYWNPSVKLDKDGRALIDFWSSDVATDYIVNIHGINSEGKMVSVKKIIKVK